MEKENTKEIAQGLEGVRDCKHTVDDEKPLIPRKVQELPKEVIESYKKKTLEHDSYVEGLKDGIQAERDGVTYNEHTK